MSETPPLSALLSEFEKAAIAYGANIDNASGRFVIAPVGLAAARAAVLAEYREVAEVAEMCGKEHTEQWLALIPVVGSRRTQKELAECEVRCSELEAAIREFLAIHNGDCGSPAEFRERLEAMRQKWQRIAQTQESAKED